MSLQGKSLFQGDWRDFYLNLTGVLFKNIPDCQFFHMLIVCLISREKNNPE
jgi:hypothetical protein